mgnify:CR=1 FL=1
MTYLEKLEDNGSITIPRVDSRDVVEIRVDLVNGKQMLDLDNVRLLLEAEMQEYLTYLLHPEFGSEWEGPDGAIYKAIMNDRALAVDRIRREFGEVMDVAIERDKDWRTERKIQKTAEKKS